MYLAPHDVTREAGRVSSRCLTYDITINININIDNINKSVHYQVGNKQLLRQIQIHQHDNIKTLSARRYGRGSRSGRTAWSCRTCRCAHA